MNWKFVLVCFITLASAPSAAAATMRSEAATNGGPTGTSYADTGPVASGQGHTSASTPPLGSNKVPEDHLHGRVSPGRYTCLPESPLGRKVAISGRVSTGPQAKRGKLSLPEQLTVTRSFVSKVLKAAIVDEFTQAVSGRDPTAARLQRLRRMAKSGHITDICFSSTDRAFRDSVVGQTFFREMAESGVHVWIEGICVAHANSMDTFTTNIKLAYAQFEADVLRERAGKRRTYAAEGTTYRRKAPFGFRVVCQPITAARGAS